MSRLQKLLLVVAISSLLVNVPVPGQSAIKNGDRCRIAGQTQAFKGKDFACVKVGKKLVWKRMPSTKPPATISLPGPTSSNTGSTPSLPMPSPTPTKVLSISERWNAIDTSVSTIFNTWATREIPKSHKVKIEWRLSSTVDPAAVDEIKRRYDLAARFWDPYETVTKNFMVIVANHNEARWICELKYEWLRRFQSVEDCYFFESNGRPNIPTAGQFQHSNWSADSYQVKNLAEMSTRFFYGRIEHEFTHNIFYEQSERYQRFMPCWQIEGGAEFFGILIASRLSLDDYIQLRNSTVDVSWMDAGIVRWTQTEWVNFLNETDRSDVVNRQGDVCGAVRPKIYHHVTLANEYLVLKVGIPGYLELIKEASRSSWAAAIQKTFGMEKQVFYSEMAEYMMTQYQLVLKNRWSYEEILRIPFGR
jgi:hypothetical protein